MTGANSATPAPAVLAAALSAGDVFRKIAGIVIQISDVLRDHPEYAALLLALLRKVTEHAAPPAP